MSELSSIEDDLLICILKKKKKRRGSLAGDRQP